MRENIRKRVLIVDKGWWNKMSIRFCKNCSCKKLVNFGGVWACPRCGSVESDWEEDSSIVHLYIKMSSKGGTKKE